MKQGTYKEEARIETSAPGSLMLLGEHAVLYGRRALVCAINRRIRVTLHPLPSAELEIVSALGHYKSPLKIEKSAPEFRFVLEALRPYRNHFPSGLRLEIHSEFSAELGFGSSAAVTTATHAALSQWVEGAPISPEELFTRGLKTIRAVQGRGSGADLAASVFGGAVEYKMEQPPLPIPADFPLLAVYCGYKKPTPEVIKIVQSYYAKAPERFEELFDIIDIETAHAAEALRANDLQALGFYLNWGQEKMEALQLSTPELQEIIETLRQTPGLLGAKISGSGLGDCAIGLGTPLTPPELDYYQCLLRVSPEGCQYHA